MRSTSRLALFLVGLAVVALTLAAIRQPVVDHSALTLRANEGRVYHEGTPFSGVSVRYEDGTLVERTEYVAGKKDGLAELWTEDGTRSYRASYSANRRDGTVQMWWPNGTLRSEATYTDGVVDGVQRQWYRSGARFKELNIVDGQEAGLQRAWRENGDLYTNYEARDGRIYGLKRANLCFELDDEQIVSNL